MGQFLSGTETTVAGLIPGIKAQEAAQETEIKAQAAKIDALTAEVSTLATVVNSLSPVALTPRLSSRLNC